MLTEDQILTYVDSQNFKELFVDLGWDRSQTHRPVNIQDQDQNFEISAKRVALKSTVSIWHCELMEGGPENSLPADVKIMDFTNRKLTSHSEERILIFTKSGEPRAGDVQIWVFADKKRVRGYARRRLEYTIGHKDPDLCQRLNAISFSAGEQGLGAFEILRRVRRIFDVEKVTTKFYKEFSKKRTQLEGEISGITNQEDQHWYTILLLNRLMFIYFIQKKGFLNNDENYLNTSLEKVGDLNGENKFYDYYRDFLIPLFHNGLGSSKRPTEPVEIQEIIGNIPYINGGIFTPHRIEQENSDIQIPDMEFEKTFNFFDKYTWHLDERPMKNPEEINPEILGHIFEQYINQKEQGAYYTKEDITQYMCSKTITPLFIDRVQNTLGTSEPGPWMLLKESPEQFIPRSLFNGENEAETKENFATWDGGRRQRTEFPDPLDPWLEEKEEKCPYRLPGETRREALERISWGNAIQEKLESGKVTDTDECITLNLELTELALSWIRATNSPELLLTAWSELKKIKVLDPTVGSGAFLRSALDILEDLYEAVFERSQALLIKERYAEMQKCRNAEMQKCRNAEMQKCRNAEMQKCRNAEYSDLNNLVTSILTGGGEYIRGHKRSTSYFIRRTVILNNLYGNELNREAAEICQLRLFLALAAVLDNKDEIEPLPDLDLNIRSGNLLVGVETVEGAIDRYHTSMFTQEFITEMNNAQEKLGNLHREFISAQHNNNPELAWELKNEIKNLCEEKRETLDQLIFAYDTGIDSFAPKEFEDWRGSHKPFHWFLEFPEVMMEGGFDVVVGNPPFIKASKVRKEYSYSGFATDDCADIYAPCIERSTNLLKNDGRFGMISPLSLSSSRDFTLARSFLESKLQQLWFSTYDYSPSSLFGAAHIRPLLLIGVKNEKGTATIHSSILRRWPENIFNHLMELTRYSKISMFKPYFESSYNIWNRTGTPKICDLLNELAKQGKYLGNYTSSESKEFGVGFSNTGYSFFSAFITDPPMWNKNKARIIGSSNWIYFENINHRNIAYLWLAGRLGYIFWACFSDAFHITNKLVTWNPVDCDAFNAKNKELMNLAIELNQCQLNAPAVTQNREKLSGRYDLRKCRKITDRADQLILECLGLENYWTDILLLDNAVSKETKARQATKNKWPTSWTPTFGPWSPELDDPDNLIMPQ